MIESNNENKKPFYDNLLGAVLSCNMTLVKMCLQSGSDINCKDKLNRSPLHLAIIWNNYQIIEYLLQNGADVNYIANNNQASYSPQTSCSSLFFNLHNSKNIKITKLLLDNNADINFIDHDEDSALHICCWNGDYKNLELLIKSGANVNVINEDTLTPLHVAVEEREIQCIVSLLENGASLHIEDKCGQTPLDFLMIKYEDVFIIKEILKKKNNEVSSESISDDMNLTMNEQEIRTKDNKDKKND